MSNRDVQDVAVVGSLGAGSIYMNFISTYGSVLITSLAILVAGITLVLRVQEFIYKYRKEKKRIKNERIREAAGLGMEDNSSRRLRAVSGGGGGDQQP
ncbi:holin protein [Xanthomonas phage L522]|nr:holin protein [Xanthomonas phage L522]